MKGLKKLLLVAAILCSLVVVAGNVQAASVWYVCTISQVGPSGESGVTFRLTDTASPAAFSNKWFVARTGREKEMLATGLTALASGLRVRVYTDISLGGNPPLNNIYLLKD